MDLKVQVKRGSVPPEHADFRVSTGGFVGTPEDEHRTIVETRMPDDHADAVINACKGFNIAAKELSKLLPDFAGQIASILGLAGAGEPELVARVYDND